MNLFDYSDYRDYLRAWLEAAKAERSSNLSRLAEVARVHPTFLSHILSGSKHLSLEQAALLSLHLGHTRLEKDYFFVLIHIDRAGLTELKEYWLEKKRQLEAEKNNLGRRFKSHHELTDHQQAIFYSSWIYIAVWTSIAIDGGQSLEQIAERFQVSRTKAEELLAFLIQIGVCFESGGVFQMGKTHVHVSNDSPFVVKHHSNWRIKAIQRMDSREDKELFFSAPMSISRKDFEVLRERFNLAIKETVELAKLSAAEDLFCLNIDLFKV
jgi:uncharacterized protein (TIGR02147 family)